MQLRQFPLIPKQAFLFFPLEEQIYQMRNNQPYRIIFEGGVTFKTEQLAKLNELEVRIKSSKQLEHLGSIKKSNLLRFLQGAKFDVQNCVQQLKKYKEWQTSFFPFTVRPDIEIVLEKGFFYLTGRDVKFRPIIVIDVLKMSEADLSGKQFQELIGYFFQFIIQNCLIQGQVETWVTIVDLAKLGILSLTGKVTDSIKSISNLFKCRLHKSYIVNCPGSIAFFYGILKKLMTEDQANKISLTEESHLPIQAFKEIFQEQIQQKYGGKRRNYVSFWPPQIQSSEFTRDYSYRLLTIQQYGLKYQRGLLKSSKVNNKILAEYKNLKNKKLRQKSENQLLRRKIQLTFKKEKQLSQGKRSQASDEDEPPQIHIIPLPFSMKDLFQFGIDF